MTSRQVWSSHAITEMTVMSSGCDLLAPEVSRQIAGMPEACRQWMRAASWALGMLVSGGSPGRPCSSFGAVAPLKQVHLKLPEGRSWRITAVPAALNTPSPCNRYILRPDLQRRLLKTRQHLRNCATIQADAPTAFGLQVVQDA